MRIADQRRVPLFFLSAMLGSSFVAVGCGGPCDTQVLGAANTAAEVFAACAVPEDLGASWTCTQPLPVQATVAELRQLHQVCDLSEIDSQERFAAAGGDPLRAAALFAWMKAEQVPGAAEAARLVAGAPPFEGELALPELSGAVASAQLVPSLTVAADPDGAPVYVPHTRWKIDGLAPAQALSVAANVSVAGLRHALASTTEPGQATLLTVLGDGVTQVALYLPAADSQAPVVTVERGVLVRDGQPVAQPEALEALQLHLPDDAIVQDLVSALPVLPEARIELAMGHTPCREPAEGMRCLAGGGSAAIPTVYVDLEPLDGDAQVCRDASLCWSPVGSWSEARERCTFRGKRLPTAAEWERAVQAGAVPAGAPPQWLINWQGDDEGPWGECDAAPHCPSSTRKLLSDGSAKVPTGRVEGPLRCAGSQAWLATLPPYAIGKGYPQPAVLEPAPDLAAIANAVESDDLAAKNVCGEDVREEWSEHLKKGGRSTVECRDPQSYVTSNEPRRHVWAPAFTNLGGGYFGVGSDQSYDFIAVARSEWAWVFDYDPNVVRLHWLLEPIIKASESPEAFVAHFEAAAQDDTIALVRASTEDPARAELLERFLRVYRGKLHAHYTKSAKPSKTQGEFGWLRTLDNYVHIRTLHQQDRLVAVGVDMLGSKGMRSVGAAAREMGVPIRIYYTSNAPTAWGGQVTDDYRQNVLSLPFDEHSVVLATFNWGGFQQVGYWHYNVMHGPLFQDRMARGGYQFNAHDLGPTWDRVAGDDPDLTWLGLPGLAAF